MLNKDKDRRKSNTANTGYLSIRGRFLISPILGIFLTVIFYITTSNIISQHSEIFAKLEQQQLPEVTQFSELIISLTKIHNDLSSLLISTAKELNEEKVYVIGREIIKQILEIETRIEQALVSNEELLSQNKSIYQRIYNDFIQYKIAAFGAIELSSVNATLAEKELKNADLSMYNMVTSSQTLMKESWKNLTEQYQTISHSQGDKELISGVALITIAIMFFSALYFSKRMTKDLVKINNSLIKLSRGNENITLPENTAPYLQESMDAVRTFQQTLIEQRQQKAELKSLNDELTEHKNNLEQIIFERTKEVKESYEKLKEAETNLIESQKLAALGSLVSGITHEINTPIGISLTAASHLIEETQRAIAKNKDGTICQTAFSDFTEEATEISDIIVSNITRASELIKSFKGVAVDQTSEKQISFEIKSYVDDILLSLRPQLKKTSHVINIHCPTTFSANTIPGALSQILTNLIVNSIVHGFENIEQGIIDITIHNKNENIEIIYQDNGVGISAEHREKVFEPFFTTKHGKGGSGLGMHIVHELVTKTLQGSIRSSGTLEEGVQFILIFPRELKHTEK